MTRLGEEISTFESLDSRRLCPRLGCLCNIILTFCWTNGNVAIELGFPPLGFPIGGLGIEPLVLVELL